MVQETTGDESKKKRTMETREDSEQEERRNHTNENLEKQFLMEVEPLDEKRPIYLRREKES